MEERYLTDFLFISESELKSYSDSFESRARDRFVAFVKELFELGSSDEYRTMFHSDKIVINKRNRRLLDYIEVSALIDRVEIISLNQEVTQRLIEIIKTEKGFETVQYDQANSRVTIPLPPLSMNQMLELSDAIIKAKENNQMAFNFLLETFWNDVFGFMLIRTQNENDAEDITIETFFKAFDILLLTKFTAENTLLPKYLLLFMSLFS